jgi:hypothetical protein
MPSTSSLLKQLNPFVNNSNSTVAEAATKISKYAAQVRTGELTIDEFKELSSDLDALKESVSTADDVANVESINTIFNGLVQLLSKI